MKVTRRVSAVLLRRELRKKINIINEVMILKNAKTMKSKFLPGSEFISLSLKLC